VTGSAKRVLICDAIAADAVERMRAGGLAVDERIGMTGDELLAVIPEYDAVVVRSATKIEARHLAAGERLKVVVRGGVGVDNIDVAAAEAEGVRVLNTPAASSVSVAELALGLMFALARQIPRADASMKGGAWDKKSFAKGMELEGKTLGILGVGRIGRALARRASGIGMVVIGADPALGTTGAIDGLTLLPAADVFARADVISLHLPKPPGAPPVIGAAEIAKMKPGVLLVNCGRRRGARRLRDRAAEEPRAVRAPPGGRDAAHRRVHAGGAGPRRPRGGGDPARGDLRWPRNPPRPRRPAWTR
jgi:phosphoglycerate dehydrogenase-like enzyme